MTRFRFQLAGRTYEVGVPEVISPPHISVETGGTRRSVTILRHDPDEGLLEFLVDHRPVSAKIQLETAEAVEVSIGGAVIKLLKPAAATPQVRPTVSLMAPSAREKNVLRAQIPGRVVSVDVKRGQRVRKGDPVLIVESMKMEATVRAPFDGQVREVKVAAGEVVTSGRELLVFD